MYALSSKNLSLKIFLNYAYVLESITILFAPTSLKTVLHFLKIMTYLITVPYENKIMTKIIGAEKRDTCLYGTTISPVENLFDDFDS
jgi:hypothetical protein